MSRPKPAESACFRKLLEPLCRSRDTYTVFAAFCRLAACAVAAGSREEEYLEEAKRWNNDELGIFAKVLSALVDEMETKPFEDVLGCYYMEFALSTKGQQWGGEFHTPKPICDLMARMTMGDMESMPKDRAITVCEPAAGAGAMILSLAEACSPDVRRRLRVTAMEINRVAADMCFINTTLWYIPCRVFCGDTIRMEFHHAWSNLPLMLSPWARDSRDDPAEQCEPPKPAEVEQIKKLLVQQEMFA